MFGRLKDQPAESSPGTKMPDGERIYAIGDIHGRVDLLDQLLSIIHDDVDFQDKNPPAEHNAHSTVTKLIFLGDYVDRGSASKEVLDRLIKLQSENEQALFLKGNHEQAMLDFIAAPEELEEWIDWGGKQTLESYGLDDVAHRSPASLRDELLGNLPDAHFQFLLDLDLYYARGDYMFVHAGLRPGIPLTEQVERDMLWIRGEFYTTSSSDWGDKCIVHGHTQSDKPENESWHINVDTGAYKTSQLTAVVLEGNKRRFIST